MASPRVHVDCAIEAPGPRTLSAGAARHVQVLRLQPDEALTLFDGRGGEWATRVLVMGRRDVQVEVLEHHLVERELPLAVQLALAMPAGERMDFVVEKATELGATAIQPLVSERSVLRLAGERAARRVAHWQAIAVAACEQCGRNRVPQVLVVQPLQDWVRALPDAAAGESRLLLGWRDAQAWPAGIAQPASRVTLLSGPEGGLTDDEQDLAHARGFSSVSLGPRVLRADTAPLAALSAIALSQIGPAT